MEETGISDSDFRQLLLDFSIWFDRLGYIDMLKVLYTDHVPIYTDLIGAETVMSLLQSLIASGNLSSTNLTIFYDTIYVTGQFGFKSKIVLPTLQRLEKHEVSKFTRFRQFLLKLGMVLTTEDINTLDVQHNEMPLLKKYTDSWHLILDLEQRKKLCEENIGSFIEGLPSYLTVKAILEGNEEPSTSKRPMLNEVDNGEESTLKQPKLDKDKIIKDYLTRKLKLLYQDVNSMTPAIWHKHHVVDIAEVFTELSLMKSGREDRTQNKSTCIRKEGKPTSLTEVLHIIKSTSSCKVLTTGKAGMGKTTLLKYITYKWATGTADDVHNAFAGKLLFLIKIGDIKAGTDILEIIMRNISTKELIVQNSLPSNSVESFLYNHADDIVLLLDGYDELQSDVKDPIYLFKGVELEKSTVVITSRPDNTVDLVKCCTLHIEVNGFSRRNIKEYIHNHFHSIDKYELGNLLMKEFRLDSEYEGMWGFGHREAFQLCSSPLLLLMICTIWEQKQHLPKDLPSIKCLYFKTTDSMSASTNRPILLTSELECKQKAQKTCY